MLEVEKLIPELTDYYPHDPVNAMKYLIGQYELGTLSATHLVSVIWSHLDMQHPINLPNFVVNPYGIHKN